MRIALAITPDGKVESVSVIAKNTEDRHFGTQLCNFLQDEIDEFERRIFVKLRADYNERYEKDIET